MRESPWQTKSSPTTAISNSSHENSASKAFYPKCSCGNKSLGVEFHRQVPVLNYIVDFYCHELFLAIEIDGHCHYTDDAKLRDKLRQEEIEALGVKFIRFNDNEVKRNMWLILDNLRDKIAQLQR